MLQISKHQVPPPKHAKFSILIPTWNNLPYLQLCLRSIKQYSHFQHEVLIHVNDGSDGTLEWLESQNISYTYSDQNIGICHALNALSEIMSTNYLVYMNDDMFVCPEWDLELWKAIEAKGNNQFFYSSTMIEPTLTGNACVIAPFDYGDGIDSFDETGLIQNFARAKKSDWYGATWPPNIVHKSLWDEVGGYSIEFSPGMASDPDFSKKLWEVGVRDFKGISTSRVYHFGSKSTGRVKKNNGRKQFLQKWGMTTSTFTKHVLRSGKDAEGDLTEPGGLIYYLQLLKSKLRKSLFA